MLSPWPDCVNMLERPFAEEQLLEQEADAWRSELLARQVHYEGRPEPFTVAPFVIRASAYRRIAEYLEPLAALIEKCLALWASARDMQDYFAFSPRLNEVILRQAAQVPPAWYCRFDFVLDQVGVPRIMEVNGDCPAGLLMQHHYQDVCRRSRLIEDRIGAPALLTDLEHADFVPAHIRALQGANRPNVAVINSRHRTLRNEVDLYRSTLSRAGISCTTGYVEDLHFREGRLWLADRPVDVALTKFDVQREQDGRPPVGADWDSIADFVQAIRAGAVLVLNGLASSVIAESKETLALLHTPGFQSQFSEQERTLIRTCIPRAVRLDRTDDAELAHVLSDKDRWVLKLCMDTRGRSVVLGSEESEQSWRERIMTCRRDMPRDYVVQERVYAHTCRVSAAFPSLPRVVHTVLGGYVVRGKLAGMLVRTSHSLVTNVGQQGFVQPHLIL
jgi:glutathionylspermidine synthase